MKVKFVDCYSAPATLFKCAGKSVILTLIELFSVLLVKEAREVVDKSLKKFASLFKLVNRSSGGCLLDAVCDLPKRIGESLCAALV